VALRVTVGLNVTVRKSLFFCSPLLHRNLQFGVGWEQTSVVTEVIVNLAVFVNVFVIRLDIVVVDIYQCQYPCR